MPVKDLINGAKPAGWSALAVVAAVMISWWTLEAQIDKKIEKGHALYGVQLNAVKKELDGIKTKVDHVAEQQSQQQGQLDTIERLLRAQTRRPHQ